MINIEKKRVQKKYIVEKGKYISVWQELSVAAEKVEESNIAMWLKM